tara:strand:+ start:404 stop:637 length:234 start_codon:yes stop_codon:yes gene_type:complete
MRRNRIEILDGRSLPSYYYLHIHDKLYRKWVAEDTKIAQQRLQEDLEIAQQRLQEDIDFAEALKRLHRTESLRIVTQ